MSLRNAFVMGSSLSLIMVVGAAASGQVASFAGTGYSENFDSMGTSGTAAPTGWRHFATGFGSNSTWTTAIRAAGANSVASAAVASAATTLTATNNPTANNNNGYNAAASAANAADRVLATAPTTVAGSILQLSLRNNSGSALAAGSSLTISFETVRFSSVGTANQLPGFWLFASTDGSTWSNVVSAASGNPDITTVPNTAGVTSRSVALMLDSSWNVGSTIYFRWVDDNAQQTSPDQIIGLNNVSIVPTPGTAVLMAVGVVGAARRRRR